MSKASIFAGLGSDALFSDATQEQAIRDSRRTTHGKSLLKTCHKVFVEEVSLAVRDSEVLTRIDLDDFRQQRSLIQPCARYHTNPVVQNATLVVVQSLRFLALEQNGEHPDIPKTKVVSGFCIGLLTAAAVASSTNDLQFLNHAVDCFRMSILVGIASQRMRRKAYSLPSPLPWSLIVGGITEEEMSELLSSYQNSVPSCDFSIFISSINSSNCLTISGDGTSLQRFSETMVPPRGTTRKTNIHSVYHEKDLGKEQMVELLAEIERRGIRFPSQRDLAVPLISTMDGSIILPGDDTGSAGLLKDILSMILVSPTDWVSVQNSILTTANDPKSSSNVSKFSVYNYGPGYGALTANEYTKCGVEVRNVERWSGPEYPSEDDIAIVGVGIDLPGASDLNQFWENLMNQKNSCSEIPDRFHIEDYYTGDGGKPVNERRLMGTKYGCFLDDPFMFDNELFGISPREAASIDPQQRIMLQTVHQALENAGYVADSTPSFRKESFGCFVGSATLDYIDNLRNDIDVYYSPGTLRAFISGRISYAFKWSGPSMTVDTACSSSLVAIYQAARSLIAGDCRAAIAGGVNVITSPDMYLGLDKAHFLSPTGQCKAFDESADGYCRSEGCASFVLKRLCDAVEENDRILGVIKGVAVNQSGKTTSITHPHAPTQEVLFKSLLSKANIDPHDISVVEAHGTGTQAGDPNELRSIRGAFARGRHPDNRLQISSLKANIGHLEAASGGAALAKLLLMLKHKRIPPQALLKDLNGAIDDLRYDGTYISTEPVDWTVQGGKKRIAMLNNFGAAGSNGALLLQEYLNDSSKKIENDPTMSYVFGCSARSHDLLQQTREELIRFLDGNKAGLRISDVCYTSTARRSLQRYRILAKATSIEGLITALEKATIVEVPDTARRIVFLFSGQGSQYLGMGKELMDLLPGFKKTVMSCHYLLKDWGFPSCLDVICPTEEQEVEAHEPHMLQAFQTGVFALEVALAKCLMDIGLQPSLVAGHSLGEFAALVIAGVLDLESGLWLVAQRANFIVQKCELFKSSMLAVNMAAADLKNDYLSLDEFSMLKVSCENSPSDCVVGGKSTDLECLQQRLSEYANYKTSSLEVPLAYHTIALEPALCDLEKAANTLTYSSPTIAIASNVLGRVVAIGERDVFDSRYIVNHCRKEVAFSSSIADAVETTPDLKAARWIEIGPHPMLLPMVVQHGVEETSSTLRKNRPASETIAELFATLYEEDRSLISWRSVFEGIPSQPKLIDLPHSSMNKKRYFVPLQREIALHHGPAAQMGTPFSFLGRPVVDQSDGETSFETPMEALAGKIKGHLVCDYALCPASVYTEMALAAMTVTTQTKEAEPASYKLSDVKFHRPLLYSEGSSKTIKITLGPDSSAKDTTFFEVLSYTLESSDAQVHCSGKIKIRAPSTGASKLEATLSRLSRRQDKFLEGDYQTFSTSIMYGKLFSRVVDYSSEYQTVKKISLDERLEEVYASCQLPTSSSNGKYAGHPILLDTMLHCAGFAANLNVDNETVCICQFVGSMTWFRSEVFAPGHEFDVHCSLYASTSDSECVLADAYATDSRGVIAVIKGMEFKHVKLSSLQTAFKHASPSSQASSPKPNRSLQRGGLREVNSPSHGNSVTQLEEEMDSVQGTDGPLTATPSCVVSILSEATGVDSTSITPRTELSAMGVDSIMIFELDRKLEEALGQRSNAGELGACKTVGDMEKLVKFTLPSSGGSNPAEKGSSRRTSRDEFKSISATTTGNGSEPQLSQEMVKLLRRRLETTGNPYHALRQNNIDSAAPLYLIHPGAGICLHYNRLQSLNRDVYTIQDSRLLANIEDDWKSMEEIAQSYSSIISNHTSDHKKIILGGWSFGGVVAFEVARLLQSASGINVMGVILIDPPPPFTHQPISRKTIESAMAATQKRSETSSKIQIEFEEAVAALTIRNNLRRAALLGKYQPYRRGHMPHIVLLRSSKGVDLGINGLPRNEWLHNREDVSIASDGWEELTRRRVQVIDIPGDHFTPFEVANLEGTNKAIREACRSLEEM